MGRGEGESGRLGKKLRSVESGVIERLIHSLSLSLSLSPRLVSMNESRVEMGSTQM